ncbi:MAG: hypothetical protein ACRDY1_15910, partial [Acidimicrobiales bacterium]
GPGPVHGAHVARRRRRRGAGIGGAARPIVALGLLDAVASAGAPSIAVLVLVIAVGLALGVAVTGGRGWWRPGARILGTALAATVVAFVLLLPWSAALLAGPERWQALGGLAPGRGSVPGLGALVRLAVGPIGNSPLSWAFLVAAALPLVIGARWRLAWAGRMWVLALVAWVTTWASGHGWLGALTPSAQVLLAPAAVAVAVAVGLGAASFESDLRGYRFGWRQAATAAAAVAAVVGVVPVVAASANGRWDLPLSGYGQATSWMAGQRSTSGAFRVLWLGDPRVLPGGGWSLDPGLAYSVSENGLGDASTVWSGSSPGAAARVGDLVELARRGSTVRLGQLLAPYAIRYVVVVDTLAPSIAGFQSPLGYAPPADLTPALLSQLDLRQIIGQGGFEVFVDDAALPERAVRAAGGGASSRSVTPATVGSAVPPAPSLSGWTPVLGAGARGATAVSGRVPAGTVLAAVAPARAWQLVGADGRVERSQTAFGYAASFTVTRPQPVTVRFEGSVSHGVETIIEILLWVVAVAFLLGRRRPGRRRPRRSRVGRA